MHIQSYQIKINSDFTKDTRINDDQTIINNFHELITCPLN